MNDIRQSFKKTLKTEIKYSLIIIHFNHFNYSYYLYHIYYISYIIYNIYNIYINI